MTMSDRRSASHARITPASHLDDVKPLPMGALNKGETDSATDAMTSVERTAYDRGLAQGKEQGRKVGFSEASRAFEQQQAQGLQTASLAATEQIQGVLANFHREFSDMEQALADKTLDLAVNIAQCIVAREINVDSDALLPLIQECISPLGDAARELKVSVNPQDLAQLESALSKTDGDMVGVISADPTISAGGCVLESPQILIDAQLETRWQRTLCSIGRDE